MRIRQLLMLTCCWPYGMMINSWKCMMHWGVGMEWRISGSLERHKWKGNQLRTLNSSFAYRLQIFRSSPVTLGRPTWRGCRLPGWSARTYLLNASQHSKNIYGGWISSGRRIQKRKPCFSVDHWGEDVEWVHSRKSPFLVELFSLSSWTITPLVSPLCRAAPGFRAHCSIHISRARCATDSCGTSLQAIAQLQKHQKPCLELP